MAEGHAKNGKVLPIRDGCFALMRAVSELTSRKVAVHAEQSKVVLREALLFQPQVETVSGDFFSVLLPITVDVVDREKLNPRFVAAFALVAVSGEDLELEIVTPTNPLIVACLAFSLINQCQTTPTTARRDVRLIPPLHFRLLLGEVIVV